MSSLGHGLYLFICLFIVGKLRMVLTFLNDCKEKQRICKNLCVSQSIKYLLSGPLHKMFDDSFVTLYEESYKNLVIK